MINKIRLIEIELFSYCNRKCNWCPNHYIDRYNNNNYFKLLPQLIQELKRNNYKGYISFSRYNEPMSNIEYFKEQLKYIHYELPECILITNTNGDYLTAAALDKLLIHELSVMDYNNKGLEYCKEKLLSCGCTIDKIQEPYIYAHYQDMKILYFTNWKKYCIINNRGGSLSEYSHTIRGYPCFEPQYFIGINYDGTVSPCCNIRNDIKQQQDYIIGDLNTSSLMETLSSQKRELFIKNCANAIYETTSPCYQCLNNGGRYTREKGGIEYD